ncbi:alpha-1,2 mannosyltransferase [Histoplasma capsulatum var. duboisii H88]|uniref:Alpha-1,2 mannosyltransferase n=1 Tax=Ajellomyces capsulatus (strain H88) TaxID=544711 RepID=F0ULZ8_AJEC8|nr:alpha-1,2 mannosyltransferase [Histoplasma capsulatum var. duboisii H88]QSS54189.1 alpha-1,2 mannosyltransferase [Histoplasma capsulatum var. duboisii H88]
MVQGLRYRRGFPLVLIALFLYFTLSRISSPSSSSTQPADPRYLPISGAPTITDHGKFWIAFHEILKVAEPRCKSPKRIEDHPAAIGFKPDEADHVTLPEHIIVEPEDKEILKTAHSRFTTLLSSPTAPKLRYTSGTRGIVSTAGGQYLPVLVTSLHMLRETGSTLPVEIFVADKSEYDEYVCGVVLPSLNAKCVSLADILDFSPLDEGLKKYQFKIFSLLFSSFEQVLFLDADSFPIHNPGELFDSEPFLSTGLVTWPDFWQVTYHPSFFYVSSQQVPTGFRHASTESGQLLVSKKSHAQMLLLSAYYNFYGPSHYYPLLSQGHPGEGDKETLVAPAMILHLPFYAVSTGPAVFGYRKPDGGWEGGVILQTNPIWDSRLPEGEVYGWGGKPNAPPESFMTCHANLPKLDPISVFGEKGLAWNSEGDPQRMWGPKHEMIEKVGFDIERRLWGGLQKTACGLESKFVPWNDKPKLCGKIEDFMKYMANK